MILTSTNHKESKHALLHSLLLVRFTGGINYLWEGIPLVPALTGLFAISQMIELALKGGSVADDATV